MAFNCFGDLGRSCWGYKLKLDSKDDGVDLCKDIKNFRLFSQEELQVATKNYSRRIGEGGFGSVYKGILKDGTEVAIKRLSRHRFDERREDFLSLIGILSCIRHRNLVQFIGCCLEKDILMVYEYVDNGNLSSFLFDSAVRSALDWPTRAAICIGTARGLVYLHEEIRPRIIHHDIKPGTILLDKNFTPRISDFEISRFLDDDFSHCSDEICGTMGYLDPEYLTSGRVTEKVDVFAFGILVLEVISGKRNSATNFDTEKRTSLVDWVWQLRENDRLLDMVDPAVVYFPEDEVINFINAALVCVQVPSNLRPRMSEVLLMLSGHYNFRGQVLRKPTQGWVPSYSHHCDTDPDLDLSFSPDQMSIREDLDDLQDLSRKEILHGKGVQSFKAPSADDVFSVNKFGKGNGSGKAECTEIKNESCLVVEDEEVMIPVSKTEIDLISFESECQSVHSNAADLITHPERSFQLNTTAAGALSGPSNELMQPEMMTGSMEPDVLYPNKADGMISFQTKSQFQEGVDLPPKVNTNQSIEFTVQEILRAFKDVQVRRIGVYGKGGIGKTTVLKTLFDHPETKNLFNLVIWVTMSRNSYRRKLQDQIIQQLSLQLHTDSEDEIAKVILNYLNGRKFLLLLDDVWEPINLHEIGFPSPAEENGWRLVLASRYVDVCLGMADRKFEVKVLSRLESWELFCLQVGEVVDFPEIQPYAQAIIEECGGLPLIIIVTGKALRMESNVLEWKLALKKFLLPTAVNDGQSVSPQLKFCYDRLESRDVKSCFLCSALFLEDKMFNVSELLEFFIDEGLLAGTIETAFERGHDIVRHLVDASLLEVSQDGKMVKMHHVVRDMALGILSLETVTCQLLVKSDFGLSELPRLEREVDGSFEKSSSAAKSAETFGTAEILPPDQYMTRAGGGLREPPAEEEWERAKMIFLMCNNLSSLPARPSCLNLSVLLLQNNFNLRVIPASFFDLMPCLRVLNLSKTRIKSLPQSLSKLESLQALILRDCERLLVLPPEIGDLKSLELLDLKGTEISKLPDTIGGLVKLKHLKVSFYGSSVRSEYIKLPHILISKGVISSPALRELGIFVYPGDQRWMLSASDITTDVSSLKLCSLSFHFPSVEQLENFLRESPSWKHGSLAKYNFIVGQDAKRIVSQVSHDVELMYDQQDRCLRFVNGENIPVSVVEVLKCATSFYLDHHLSICSLSEFGIGNIQQLKFCIVRDCPKLEELINDTEFKSSVLPALEHLSINCLWNLRRIWCGHLPTGSFSQLRHLSVHGCPQLTFLLTCSMIGGFSNLKELIVEDCPLLEDVVREEEAPAYGVSIMEVTDPPQLITSRVTSLRKLEALRLHYLPKLSVIWKGPWPSLKYMSFYNCPNLKNLHLDSSVEASIEQIKAEEYWWDSLAWDDAALSSRLRNHVTYISDGADSGVNLNSASSVGKDLNDSTSKGSSFSVAPMPRSEGEILLSPNLESSSDQIKEENLESPGFSELGMATSKCHLDSVLGEGGFTNKGSSFSVPPTPGSEGEILQSPNLKSFTFSELKTATRNFRPDSILGEGAFGPVFKGWIEEDAYAPSKPGMGMAIAVRKLHPECYQGHKEWLAHVNYLGLLCHPHLVRLLGYCLEDEHRLLVYEFMPRGSLENHLFRRVVQPLSWNLRLKVALGAAKGLAFLHNAETIVIHWDFKTSNVLLDSNYNAKLSDFWLAKDWPSGGKSDVSRRVTGTYGYIAPEYVATGHLYAKSTVYSYGVVLLEMLSGQRAVDRNRPPGRHNLVEWARPYLTSKRKVIRILDNRLKGQYNLDAAHKAATIAFQCLSREAKLRPTMAEVVKELEQLHDFMETGSTHNSGSGTGIKSANKYRGCLQFKSRYSTHPGTSASSLYAQRKGETHPGTYSSCDSA